MHLHPKTFHGMAPTKQKLLIGSVAGLLVQVFLQSRFLDVKSACKFRATEMLPRASPGYRERASKDTPIARKSGPGRVT